MENVSFLFRIKQNLKQFDTSPCDFMLLHHDRKPYTGGENTVFSGAVSSLVKSRSAVQIR